MLKHYLAFALRCLAKNKGQTVTNLFGLVAGLASCALILLFVRYEMSYDAWLPSADRVYQVQLSLHDPNAAPVDLQMAPYPAAAALAKDFPQIEAAAGSFTSRPVILRDGVASLPARDALMADPDFFRILQVPFVNGDPAAALRRPNSVALSESEARRYFKSPDEALGKILTILHRGQRRDVSVTGVFRDLPPNSHLAFPMVFRLNPADYANEPGLLSAWDNISGYVYLKLKSGVDVKALSAGLRSWEQRNIRTPAGARPAAETQTYRLTPVTEVHLGRNQVASMTPGSNRTTLMTFAAVAVMILGIACFNFVNLSTARATQRAREVGIRKVLGATRADLLLQFVIESMIVVVGALVMALTLVELALPAANRLLGVEMRLSYFGPQGIWLPILAVTLIVGVLGAMYPAFYLSRFEPAAVMKANKGAADAPGSARLRATLAAIQFSVVIGLLVCTSVVYAQTLHSRLLDVGYQRRGLIRVDNLKRDQMAPVAETLLRELGRLDGVKNVGRASIAPATGNVSVTTAMLPGHSQPVSIGLYNVDEGFFPTMQTRLVAGRTLSERYGLDDSSLPALPDANAAKRLAQRGMAIVLSKAAVKRLGFASPAQALGRQVRLGFIDPAYGSVPATVVGVVQDVRYRSVREEVEPIAYRLAPQQTSYLLLRYESRDPEALVAAVRKLWHAHAPDVPFEATFVEDALAHMYDSDAARGHLFAISSGLAVVIGAFGLFGLAAFVTERKTLEIGLRKIFGARVADIVGLLVWQFSRPVLLANLIAWPLAWWTMRGWLNGFDDRIALSPFFFFGSGLFALAVAMATVAGHTIRVARRRPIDALRYE